MFWSFEALKRGAREVLAIDDFSDYLGSLDRSERKAWGTFDLCREAFGYERARCERCEVSVYDVTPERFGRFDVIFCFGTLYHLRHPLLAPISGSVFGSGYLGGQVVAESWIHGKRGGIRGAAGMEAGGEARVFAAVQGFCGGAEDKKLRAVKENSRSWQLNRYEN